MPERVTWGDIYQGKYVRLVSNIGTSDNPVTTMVGEANETNCFKGIFEGEGCSLTVKYEERKRIPRLSDMHEKLHLRILRLRVL